MSLFEALLENASDELLGFHYWPFTEAATPWRDQGTLSVRPLMEGSTNTSAGAGLISGQYCLSLNGTGADYAVAALSGTPTSRGGTAIVAYNSTLPYISVPMLRIATGAGFLAMAQDYFSASLQNSFGSGAAVGSYPATGASVVAIRMSALTGGSGTARGYLVNKADGPLRLTGEVAVSSVPDTWDAIALGGTPGLYGECYFFPYALTDDQIGARMMAIVASLE